MTAPASEAAQAAVPVCPACEAPGAELCFPKNGYGIHSCRGCGTEFLHPQPSDAVLASIYGANYALGVHDERSEARFEQMKRATAA